MRTRDLKPSFFRSEALAALPAQTRLLYQGLWLMADREGRLLDNTKLISADVFPYEKVNVERGLAQLAAGDEPFIVRYQVGAKRCIWLPEFLKDQRPHPHEVASQLPPCPDEAVTLPLQSNDSCPPMTRHDPSHSLTLSHSSDLASSDLSSLPSVAPAVATAMTKRERLKGELSFSDEEWREVLAKSPGVNVHARYWDWVDWIGERERERKPDKPLAAFIGFIKNGKKQEG